MSSSRSLSSGFAAALASAAVQPFPLLDLMFSSGPAYLCGIDYAVTYAGNTYTPALGLMGIEVIKETASSAQGLAITLSGVSSGALAMALAEQVQGRSLVLRMAIIDATGTLLVDANAWSGLMDVMTISDGTDSATIQLTAEHIMGTWDRPRSVLYTDAQQQVLYPGDLGLQYVAQVAQASIVWPDKSFFKQ